MNQALKQRNNVAGTRHIRINVAGATTSGTTTVNSANGILPPAGGPDLKAVENAVYGHLRAIRALGRTQVTASEIATALSISQDAVVQALAALRNKGVKFE